MRLIATKDNLALAVGSSNGDLVVAMARIAEVVSSTATASIEGGSTRISSSIAMGLARIASSVAIDCPRKLRPEQVEQ